MTHSASLAKVYLGKKQTGGEFKRENARLRHQNDVVPRVGFEPTPYGV